MNILHNVFEHESKITGMQSTLSSGKMDKDKKQRSVKWGEDEIKVRVISNALQHTATHCNTLQHTATYCNTKQHTETYYTATQKPAVCEMGRRLN